MTALVILPVIARCIRSAGVVLGYSCLPDGLGVNFGDADIRYHLPSVTVFRHRLLLMRCGFICGSTLVCVKLKKCCLSAELTYHTEDSSSLDRQVRTPGHTQLAAASGAPSDIWYLDEVVVKMRWKILALACGGSTWLRSRRNLAEAAA